MTKLSEKTGGGLIYAPPMMEFDGASYYSKAVTTSGNKITAVARINFAEFDGGAGRIFMHCFGTYARVQLFVLPNDHADTAKRNKVSAYVQNSAGTVICWLFSSTDLTDGENHTVFFSFDGDAGTAVFRVDGVDEDDTGNAHRVAPTTGTLDTTSTAFSVGASSTGSNDSVGSICFAGYKDAYLTNWQDFMDGQGNPKALDQFGWTQWGGGTFAPATQDFDGSTGYFSKTGITTSGNKVTATARFAIADFAGTAGVHIFRVYGNTYIRALLYLAGSGYSDANNQNKLGFLVQSSTGTNLARLISSTNLNDGNPHTVFCSFDGDAGTAVFRVDGVDEDDTGNASRIAPTTGTLDTGASSLVYVGAAAGPSNLVDGDIGFFGHREAYLTNWGDFMDASGVPLEIDELNWTEWGGQPLFWNKYGAMDDNQGSAGNMTRTGTVTSTPNSRPLFWHPAAKMDENEGEAGAMTENGTILLSDAGSQGLPALGLNTLATAIAADIRSGKTAYVDGLEIVGAAYYPAMMEFDGSTGYFSKGYTSSGDAVTLVGRFKVSSFSGGSSQQLIALKNSGVDTLGNVAVISSDHATTTRRNKLMVFVSGICTLVSSSDVADGLVHTFFVSVNGTTGTAIMRIDGNDELDTGNPEHSLIIGTRATGASSNIFVGAYTSGPTLLLNGELGFCGAREAYLTNWSDFMDANGNPKALDESTWTEWGAQPLIWNEHGDMENNLGSAGAMTKTGTIVVGKGGNT